MPDFSYRLGIRRTCNACLGAGAWDRRTGEPVYTRPRPSGVQVCPLCLGTGLLERPLPTDPYR